MSSLKTEDQNGVLIVEMPERMVMANAPQVRNEIKEIISSKSSKIVIDLRPVEFVDSSGLSVLISSLNAAKELGGDVVLLDPSKTVRSLIELTRLHHVFQIFQDVDSAISNFG